MTNDIFALWDENKTRINDISDIYTKNKYLLTRNKADAKKDYQQFLERYKFSDIPDYVPSSGMLEIMPKYSLFLQFKFFLSTPYISRDDEGFYIIDNPIKKDKVFKVPMVSGSSWKGNMRWVAQHIETDPAKIINLFGNEKKVEKDFKRGRLNFYTTFFNQIGLEVINPHDRKTKAGIQPIYIESVPGGADGTFSLLYMPFDLMGRPGTEVKEEVIKDLEAIYPAIKNMMLTYGFSAKRSSGFGIAKNELSDVFCEMNGIEIKKSPKKDSKQKSKIKSFKELKVKEQKTFNDLEDRLKAIVVKLLNSGGNNA
ncbi:RAMP superfamily CRISPR-associated protein [Candidatus Acidulodesulfobacterium sp. H_13]|uniref:RAMP superfamily CRISPR-associated protein n=1 Tax=Candidatus Acidulodesulfobacterium sp. H_13 TaxID=3395470 RepID=UPI003AF69C0C